MPPGIAFDPALPAAAGLFDEPGAQRVAAFLAARGWELRRTRPVQAIYRPAAACAVRYRSTAVDPDGRPRLVNLCLETRAAPKTPRAPNEELTARYGLPEPLAADGDGLAWVFPCDPAMPHLADALWGPAVRERLDADGPRPLRVRAQPLRYRPRRRAVVRYHVRYGGDQPARELYGKVLRTAPAQRLRAVTAELPAGDRRRRRFGRPRPGVRFSLPVGELHPNTLLFEAMPGTPLGRLLVRGGSLPRPERLVGLLDEVAGLNGAVAAEPATRHAREPVETAERTAALVAALVPECADDAAAVLDAVRAGAAVPGPDRAVVHGDLYEAQVFVDDDFSLGLIDLEEMGVGDPALDAANFTAHLLALALVAPAARARIRAYRHLLRTAFLDRLELPSEALAWREALVMLQLATGPFRTLAPDWPGRVARGTRVARRLAAETAA